MSRSRFAPGLPVLLAVLFVVTLGLSGCGTGVLKGRGGGGDAGGGGGNGPSTRDPGGSGGGGGGGGGSAGGGGSDPSTGRGGGGGGSQAGPGYGELPQLWVHGVPKQPQFIVPLNADGGRMFVDVRRFNGTEARNYLREYLDNELGICLTLRWQDPADKEAPDIAPSPAEAKRQTDLLMSVLTSPESKQLEGRIWVQFFNEFTGGPGSIQPEEADTMFGWATETALRIRKEAPHIMICGPALAGIEVLQKEERTLTSMGQARLSGLRRGIEWSARYAEAIDLHIHLAEGQTAREWIRLIRDELNRYPGGENTYILSFEWSPARYPNQENLDGAMDALRDIYRAMAEARFPIAGYACFYPAYNIGQIFHWQSIAFPPDRPGTPPTPNEPFWGTLSDIGAGKIDVPSMPSSTDLNPSVPVTEIRNVKPVT